MLMIIKDGLAKWYFDNEQLSMQYIYNHGLIIDTAYAYYKNGELKSTYVYSDNKLNGEKIVYYLSGIIKEKGVFMNDQKHGTWCEYDSLGYKIKCLKYKNGIPQ